MITDVNVSLLAPEEQKAHALPGVQVPQGPPSFWRADAPWRSSIAEIQRPEPTHPTEKESGDVSDNDDVSEEEGGATGKKGKKKKKSTSKSKKRSQVTSDGEDLDELDGAQKFKRRKGKAPPLVEKETARPPTAKSPASGGGSGRCGVLDNITNTIRPLHLVSPKDVNSIDLLLLALGVSPGSFIPNCGPNDCPNPFAESPPLPSGSNATYPTGKEVIIESLPTVTDSQTWPDGWFADARAYLGCFKLGPNWDRLIDIFTMLEAKWNFVKAGKALQRVDRPPPQVSLWIQNARNRDSTPLSDRNAFVASWWKWWRQMQLNSQCVMEGEGPVSPET